MNVSSRFVSHSLLHSMPTLEERLARGARWLTARDPFSWGVGLLTMLVSLALFLPWLQQSRNAARQIQTKDNLRRLGTAIFSYSDLHGSLPPAGVPLPHPPEAEQSRESSTSSSPSPAPSR